MSSNITIQGLYKEEEDNSYNAFEKDIAVVHFFFQVTFESVNCKNDGGDDDGSPQYSIKISRNRQCSNSDGH